MKNRTAYIDHSYHKKTGSTKFFIDLVSGGHDVDLFWDESWNGGPPVNFGKIAEGRYDAIVLFQTMYPAYVIDMLGCDNIVFIPMYDNVHNLEDSFWLQYQGKARFVSFSRTLNERLSRLGLESKYVQYFMEPQKAAGMPDFTCLRGFFWQRQHDITWSNVRRLIKKAQFSRFHLHGAVDPNFDFYHPSKSDVRKYHIQTSMWFQSKKDYSEILKDSNVFFASRLYEGIGMSFVEAMTLGQCVVVPDSPTMNEYITHGETGLLYDNNKIRPLDFSSAEALGRRARDYCIEGFLRWNNQKGELIDYIYQPVKQGRLKAGRIKKAGVEAGTREKTSRLYSILQQQYILSESINRENAWLKAELKNMNTSYSYRIGSLLLMPVKALLEFLRRFSR